MPPTTAPALLQELHRTGCEGVHKPANPTNFCLALRSLQSAEGGQDEGVITPTTESQKSSQEQQGAWQPCPGLLKAGPSAHPSRTPEVLFQIKTRLSPFNFNSD